MGVQGLWKLLESAGKPIPVENLENKVLSIDVSIWLYQIVKGVQENEHSATTNGHLIVMFHRICKLLFYGIKPIFVFDGGVPELKKLTIAQRQAQKSRAKRSSGKVKEKVLKNMLEQAALKSVTNPGSTLTVDEVISRTVRSMNKGEENDLFELPKLPESFDVDNSKTPTVEDEQAYLSSPKKKRENILLLAVKNQDNDFLYTNSAQDKEKANTAKLNTFSSLQIGELLSIHSDDQKRSLEKKTQQKSKREMTFNELEMFLNNDEETNKKIDEFSQKIDSEQDTVYYYESNFNKTTKNSSSKNKFPMEIKTSNSETHTKTELDNSLLEYTKSSCSKYNESPKKSTNTDSELDVKTISNNSFLESSPGKTFENCRSMNNESPKKTKTSNLKTDIETESKKSLQKLLTTDNIGSPTLTEDIDEDIFKALAGDESLEEDRLAWLIFNENKKASKKRSDEFESPKSKYSKVDTDTSVSSSEVLTSDMEEDISIKNSKASSKKHSSKSIFITDDDVSNETYLDNFDEEDYLSWVSHTKDEPNKPESKMRETCNRGLDVPSTSKCTPLIKENEISSNKSSLEQQNITKSIYFASKLNERNEHNVSPSLESDHSDFSFSDNSLDFSPEETLSNDEDKAIISDKQEKEAARILSPKKKSDCQKTVKTKPKEVNATNHTITEKLNAQKKLSDSFDQTNYLDQEYLMSLEDTLVKQQNDLANLQKTSSRMASSVTQKITSDIKNLLKLFGIPYITAPMEAEAQCVFLEKIGRTEGTVTDDSDVWLFGANNVYKDFFDSKKYVKQFKSIDIKHKFALSQKSFIQLAFLVGSDYTNGIDGIGPVSAIEILSFIEPKTKVMSIEEKLLKIKEIANSKSEIYSDVPFVKKLKTAKIGNDFPNKAVINAYLNPIVNESNEKFSWGTPEVELIVQFAQTNFDWDVSKTKSTLAPVLKKVSARTTQKSLDSYVKILPSLSNTNSGMSKRVSLAVKRLQKDGSSVETNNQNCNSTNVSAPTNSPAVTKKKVRKTLK